jgi:hypothetical protein
MYHSEERRYTCSNGAPCVDLYTCHNQYAVIQNKQSHLSLSLVRILHENVF